MSAALRSPLEDYFGALSRADIAEATDVVLALLDDGMPLGEITGAVLVPAQVRVGHLWEVGDWSVADEHAATAVTEAALAALVAAAGRPQRGGPPHILVACAEGEWHSLPARLAGAVAGTGEARVTVLGPSLPAAHLRRRLQAGDVDLLALSCTLPVNLLGAARCISAAHEAGVPVTVGGRAFGATPQRAQALGADSWAAGPDALLEPPPALTGVCPDIPLQVIRLDAVEPALVDSVAQRLVATAPSLAGLTPAQQDRTREDLTWMARFAGAALLTHDASVLDELLSWLCALLAGRVGPDVIALGASLLASALEPVAPDGAALLRTAASKQSSPQRSRTP